MSTKKHEGQYSTGINRVIRRRAFAISHNRFPHKWTYCGSPTANIFSRPGHNPRRFSRATKDRQREILSIVQKRFIVILREKNRLHPVPPLHYCFTAVSYKTSRRVASSLNSVGSSRQTTELGRKIHRWRTLSLKQLEFYPFVPACHCQKIDFTEKYLYNESSIDRNASEYSGERLVVIETYYTYSSKREIMQSLLYMLLRCELLVTKSIKMKIENTMQ